MTKEHDACCGACASLAGAGGPMQPPASPLWQAIYFYVPPLPQHLPFLFVLLVDLATFLDSLFTFPLPSLFSVVISYDVRLLVD